MRTITHKQTGPDCIAERIDRCLTMLAFTAQDVGYIGLDIGTQLPPGQNRDAVCFRATAMLWRNARNGFPKAIWTQMGGC